ncbi:hypothetical protein RLF98_02765 [Flavonifractor plautii]|uniref:hypothetical protein n=1 Tax=Flavonifractor plautii TaxID=292800 RepID=UPI00287D0FFD|nr:hypothetical protein [Flavonifractor plautii]MDS9665404.1 hypothetical protein [Flavonifractor plautii]
MKLTEAEMRMVFQIESTNQNAALNEIYMTWRYAPNPATKETAESLLDKLRPLSDQECMDSIRKVQTEYRLPEKARTIGEMLAEARQRSGAQKLWKSCVSVACDLSPSMTAWTVPEVTMILPLSATL